MWVTHAIQNYVNNIYSILETLELITTDYQMEIKTYLKSIVFDSILFQLDQNGNAVITYITKKKLWGDFVIPFVTC